MQSKLRNALLNVSLLLGTLILFLGGIEIALRVTGLEKGHPFPPPIYQKSADARISYELKPHMHEKAFRHMVTTNSLGFRSPELDPAKKTIAVLGDSITFGYGLADNETMPAQLQTLLPQYNVLNAGVPGYTLEQEAATFETKIAPLPPSALIVIFYPNDLVNMDAAVLADTGNIVPKGSVTTLPQCEALSGFLATVPGHCWLDLHSSFFRAIKKFTANRTAQTRLVAEQAASRANLFDESIPASNVERYAGTLDAFMRTVPAALPRLFVIWPDREVHMQVRPQLQALAASHGFVVLDLYEIFGNSAETLSWDTVHPSAKTAREAAAVIAAALEHYRLLP